MPSSKTTVQPSVQHSVQRQRLAIVSLAFLVAATFLGLRLLQKSVVEHGTYKALAKGQQYQKADLSGKRGQILIKDGMGKNTYPLATNQTVYALNVVPSQVADKRRLADAVAPIAMLGADKVFADINNSKQYIPPLKRGMTYDEAKQIEALQMPGVYTLPESQRFYPEDGLAAQVLGFVNAEGKGQYGVEGFFDDSLLGKNGFRSNTQNASGEGLGLGPTGYAPPKDGDNIVLTIDRNVQFQAELALQEAVKKFSASGGSLIVMNPQTGAIVAMASAPSFDPNRYSSYAPEAYLNQAVSATYEPGSTFKTISMAAALDAGVVTPNTTFNGTACVKVSDREICNAEKIPYGRETMTEVIQRSDNVGMVYISRQLGGAPLYDYLQKFGFGVPTGLEVAGEVSPDLPIFAEQAELNFATMSFGQGISVTPIQLITAVSSFANQGKLMQPHLVEQIQREDGKVETVEPKEIRQVVSPQAASQISGMMVRVVEAGSGKPAAVPGYRIAGKTGTAQIAQNGGYDPKNTIGNFVGFGPVDNPRFVMLVKVDRPQGVTFAEESAAPTFGTMAKFLMQYYNVPPG